MAPSNETIDSLTVKIAELKRRADHMALRGGNHFTLEAWCDVWAEIHELEAQLRNDDLRK